MKQKNIFRLMLVLFSLWGLNISNVCGQTTHWTPVSGGSGNIIIYTHIYIEGVLANRGDVELGAFRVADDECRGSALAVDTWDEDDYYVTLMVSGEAGDSFYYRIYDHSTGKEYVANGITLTDYTENATFGKHDDPLPTTSSILLSSLTIDGSITNGSIDASPAGAIEAGDLVTLTIHPAAGYELSAISAYKSNDLATTYNLTGSGTIDGSTRTFNMPGYNTTVTAAFAPSQAQKDVDEAKSEVEGGSYTVAQGTANSENDVKNWLVTEINDLLGLGTTGVTIAASDITFSGFTAATAGGSNGSFNFTVTLSKSGASNATTSALSGTITAKTAQTAPSAPTEASKTAESITLDAITDAEYSKDGTTWQDAVLFDNLTPNTQYTFYARLKETATLAASPASTGTTITTDKATLGGTVTIDGSAVFGEELTAVTTGLTSTPIVDLGTLTYQWKRNGTTDIGTNSDTYTLVEADIATTITVTVTAANCTGEVTSGATGAVDKATPSAPAAPTAITANITATSITLDDIAGAEYSSDGTIWQDAVLFDNLTPNTGYTFYARIKETVTHYESATSPESTTITTNNADLGGSVAITGSAIFDETLTAVTDGLTSTPTVALGTLTYQWQRGGTDISGATGNTYKLAEADINATITVTVTAANCAGSVTSTPTGTVAKATPSAAPAAPTELSKTESNITLNDIAGAEYSLDDATWQDGTTFSSLTPNTSYTFYARLKETATHNASPSNSASISTAVAVISISSQPAVTTTVTEGSISGSLSVTASVTGGATLSYEWFSNTTADNMGGTTTGETGGSFTIPTGLTETGSPYYYYCVVSATGGATDVTSNVATVVVNTLTNAGTPDITTQPQDATVNTGDLATLSVTAASPDGGTLSYQWYSNTANDNSTGTLISGAESDTYSPPTTAVGTIYYYVEVTNTLATATGVPTATVVSATAAVTANPTYTATVSPASHTFAAAATGYGPQTERQFTVTNTGTGQLTNVDASLGASTGFEISTALNSATINAGGTATVSVRPATGLAAGSYTATLTITGDNGINETVSLSFTVNATYTVTVSSAGTGATGSGNYASSATVNINAGTAPAGQQFKNWTASPTVTFADANSASTSFTMPASAVTVTANFEPIPVSTYGISIGSFTGGSVSANKTAAAAGETVTLTVYPSSGYELDDISVYRISSPYTSVTLYASNGDYSFTMPAYDVTVAATFRKTQAQLDKEAVEAAKAAIEDGTYQVAQAMANETASVKTWLVNTLSTLFSQSHGMELRSAASIIDGYVAVTAITPATAGTESNPSGVNGAFTFTVTLNRGASNATATVNSGVIIATPYSSTTGIEDVPQSARLYAVSTSGGLQVHGLVPGEVFSIYNISGQLQFKGKATTTEQLVPLRERGVYIVVSGNRRVKTVY